MSPLTSQSALVNGFRFANSQGAKIVNLSFSLGTISNDSFHTTIQNELTTLFDNNIFIVTSAGKPTNSDVVVPSTIRKHLYLQLIMSLIM